MRNDSWTMGYGVRPPILSIGMILFSIGDDGNLKYLMVRRKTTVGFMDFVRGKFDITNTRRLRVLIDTMTVTEKNDILTKNHQELWEQAWGEDHETCSYRFETEHACSMFNSLGRGISINGIIITLKYLVEESKSRWSEPEWEFPKGRRNFQEKDIDCAYREVSEETGLSRSQFHVIENIMPLEEIFIGSNMKTYKYKYFIANVLDTSDDLSNYQISEIGDVRWFTFHEAIDTVREYHRERKKIIEDTKSTLESLRLFYTN